MAEGTVDWAEIAARARQLCTDVAKLRRDATGLQSGSRRRLRRAEITGVERMIERVTDELGALDPTVKDWDGVGPPPEHLFERVGTVEAHLGEAERRLRALTQRLHAPLVGDQLLLRCAWCQRFNIGELWLDLETVSERGQQIGDQLLETCSHGICPSCFEKQMRPHPR